MFLYIGIVDNGYYFKSLLVYELIVGYISIDFVKYCLFVCLVFWWISEISYWGWDIFRSDYKLDLVCNSRILFIMINLFLYDYDFGYIFYIEIIFVN